MEQNNVKLLSTSQIEDKFSHLNLINASQDQEEKQVINNGKKFVHFQDETSPEETKKITTSSQTSLQLEQTTTNDRKKNIFNRLFNRPKKHVQVTDVTQKILNIGEGSEQTPLPKQKPSNSISSSFDTLPGLPGGENKTSKSYFKRKASAPLTSLKWTSQQIIPTVEDFSKTMDILAPAFRRVSLNGLRDVSQVRTFESIFQLFDKQLISRKGLFQFLTRVKAEDLLAILEAVREEVKKVEHFDTLIEMALKMVQDLTQSNGGVVPKSDPRVQFLLFLQGVELELLCAECADFSSYEMLSALVQQLAAEGNLLIVLKMIKREIKKLPSSQRSALITLTRYALTPKKSSIEDLPFDKRDPRTQFLAFLRGIELALLCESQELSGNELAKLLGTITKDSALFSLACETAENDILRLSESQRSCLVQCVCTMLSQVVEMHKNSELGGQHKLEEYARGDDPLLHFMFFLRIVELERMFGRWLFLQPVLLAIPDIKNPLHKIASNNPTDEDLAHPQVIMSVNVYFEKLYEHMQKHFVDNTSFELIQKTLLSLYTSGCDDREEAEKRFVMDFFFRNIIPEMREVGLLLQQSFGDEIKNLGNEFLIFAKIIQKIISQLHHQSETNFPIGLIKNYVKIKRLILGEKVEQVSPALPRIKGKISSQNENNNDQT